MSSKSKGDLRDFAILMGILLSIAVGADMLSDIQKRNKVIEKKCDPKDYLSECYKPWGNGDAAYFIKQEDRLYGTRQHEAQVDKALGAINAQAICDHKKRQGVECN
jgi:hypothetical protein